MFTWFPPKKKLEQQIITRILLSTSGIAQPQPQPQPLLTIVNEPMSPTPTQHPCGEAPSPRPSPDRCSAAHRLRRRRWAPVAQDVEHLGGGFLWFYCCKLYRNHWPIYWEFTKNLIPEAILLIMTTARSDSWETQFGALWLPIWKGMCISTGWVSSNTWRNRRKNWGFGMIWPLFGDFTNQQGFFFTIWGVSSQNPDFSEGTAPKRTKKPGNCRIWPAKLMIWPNELWWFHDLLTIKYMEILNKFGFKYACKECHSKTYIISPATVETLEKKPNSWGWNLKHRPFYPFNGPAYGYPNQTNNKQKLAKT